MDYDYIKQEFEKCCGNCAYAVEQYDLPIAEQFRCKHQSGIIYWNGLCTKWEHEGK